MSWSVLQSASGTNGGGTTLGVAFTTQGLTSGTKIVVAIAVEAATGGTNDMTSVVLNDTAATALTSLSANPGGAGGSWQYLYAVDTPSDAVGTKPTVTLTWNNADHATFGLSMLIQEVSGLTLPGTLPRCWTGPPGRIPGQTARVPRSPRRILPPPATSTWSRSTGTLATG